MSANSLVFTHIPHHVMRPAFGPEMAERLVSYAISREPEFDPTMVSAGGDRHDPSIRISSSLSEWPTMRNEVEARMRALFPALSGELRAAPFELTEIELELVQHGDGAFYGPHIDTRTGNLANVASQRMLSAVYYFHHQPKAFSGGALRLYALAAPAGKSPEFVDIEPENDMLLVFPSWVPHEVRKVSCPSGSFADSRFAINCWFCRQPAP
jgi:SM-20-related protein